MTLRDHRNKAKQWSYGRAQLAPASAGAHYGRRRTKLTQARVKAGEREQLQRDNDTKGANDHERNNDHHD